MLISYDFSPLGMEHTPQKGRVYVDVGNRLCPGILDHHQPDAPSACAAKLVLQHPDYVLKQIDDDGLMIIPHQYPDMDAITGAYFAKMIANEIPVCPIHQAWAKYVCLIDQGFTELSTLNPVTPYSLFIMRTHQLRKKLPQEASAASRMILENGFDFLDAIFNWLDMGGDLLHLQEIETFEPFSGLVEHVTIDLKQYQKDIDRAETFTCKLPTADNLATKVATGLWLQFPKSIMFKSWARGDFKNAEHDHGFTFLAIQVSEQRYILSVHPGKGVTLKGLGDLLNQAELNKRAECGKLISGNNRQGYNSPDPWYDGRSPLHNFTIIDSPRHGTILNEKEIKSIFHSYVEK